MTTIAKNCDCDKCNKVSVKAARKKMEELFNDLFHHNGYGRLEVDMKILKKGQKEIIVRFGKEFRYVVDFVTS